jgi:hypothetical protein
MEQKIDGYLTMIHNMNAVMGMMGSEGMAGMPAAPTA